MVYIHNENGDVINTYSEASGIEYVLEYGCFTKLNGFDREDIGLHYFFIACRDWEYLHRWIEQHDYMADTIDNKGRLRKESSCAVLIGGDNYIWHSRMPIKIDYEQDYHFYPNKSHSIEKRKS